MCVRLDDRQLRGSDIKSIDIRRQSRESLLSSIRANQSVDLNAVNIIQLLQRSLNLALVGLDIHDKNQRVVLLDLLHGGLGVERVHDDLVVVETGLVRDALAGVLGCARQLEGLGAVEGRRLADLARLLGVDLEIFVSLLFFYRLNGRKGDLHRGGWPLRLDSPWWKASCCRLVGLLVFRLWYFGTEKIR
jgi:hypothetical protein